MPSATAQQRPSGAATTHPYRQVSAHVERELRAYLECGILAHGFARAFCDACGHDFLIAFSCKGRGVCPSCTTQRMSFTAAHLVSAVIPPVPVRQWVLSVPKRLRYFLARDGEFLNRTIALAIRHIEQCLQTHTPLADPTARLGAVVFIQRFGSLLNAHTHLHLIVLDGLCQHNPEGGVRFLPAGPIDQDAVLGVQQTIRAKLLAYASSRGFLQPDEARDMLAWAHGGGFSLDASVRIPAHERDALERLLRYCARPAFAQDRLRQIDASRYRYDATKPGPKGNVSLIVSPLELLDRLAALVPPPRAHRHRYFGCLAPNAPLRQSVALWTQAYNDPLARPGELSDGFCAPPNTLAPPASDPQPDPAPASTAQWRWAALLARLFECFPLICLHCNGPMRIIAFITDPIPIKTILSHLDLPTSAPRPSPARGPPQNPHPGSLANHDLEQLQSFDHNAQPAPPFQFDQRISW